MATLTPSILPPVGAVHAGVNALVCPLSISASGTTSAGDIMIIGRLPHGAQLLDSVFYPGAALNGVSVMNFGTSASAEMFLAADTYSVAVARQITTLVGQRISLSDEAMPRYQNVIATLTTALTAGVHGRLVIFYKM